MTVYEVNLKIERGEKFTHIKTGCDLGPYLSEDEAAESLDKYVVGEGYRCYYDAAHPHVCWWKFPVDGEGVEVMLIYVTAGLALANALFVLVTVFVVYRDVASQCVESV